MELLWCEGIKQEVGANSEDDNKKQDVVETLHETVYPLWQLGEKCQTLVQVSVRLEAQWGYLAQSLLTSFNHSNTGDVGSRTCNSGSASTAIAPSSSGRLGRFSSLRPRMCLSFCQDGHFLLLVPGFHSSGGKQMVPKRSELLWIHSKAIRIPYFEADSCCSFYIFLSGWINGSWKWRPWHVSNGNLLNQGGQRQFSTTLPGQRIQFHLVRAELLMNCWKHISAFDVRLVSQPQ